MSTNLSSQAEAVLNVRVVVGKPQPDGSIRVSTDRRFKNTATRLMTESICNYIAGAENTYKRGHGRPNYMGIGTMGITKQPTDVNAEAEVADNFEDTTYIEGETTRPWFESTSLALTTVCGPVNTDTDSDNLHFWDPAMAWGKDGFTGNPSTEPIFQGELCTNLKHSVNANGENQRVYEDVERIPILRADVLSDCPADWDYGVDGYSSQVIFYAYASVEWVHRLLKPIYKEIVKDPITGEETTVAHEVGPQLDKMAISEFGLYEKNNTDPHGLETLLAGFRVPSADDLVYVTDGEVMLIEWRVTTRAVMPNEGVRIVGEPAPTGVAVVATYVGETQYGSKEVQLAGIVRGDPGVRQGIIWTLDNKDEVQPGTHLATNGLLTVDKNEKVGVLYVSGASVVDPFVTSRTAILTGLLKNFVTGITLSTEPISGSDIQFRATVLGKGTFSQNVTWRFGDSRPVKEGTVIDSSGMLHIDSEETADEFQIVATSVEDENVMTVGVIVRIDYLEGTYIISDLTIQTEGDS